MKYVTTFGGSEFKEDSIQYKEAIELGEWLAEKNYIVKCGGYYGLMEAVSKGVSNKNGKCIGVTNASFNPKKANKYISKEIKEDDLFDRLRELMTDSKVFIIQEGSLGTLTELVLLWCLYYTGSIKNIKVYLIGKSWNKVIDGLKNLYIQEKEFEIIEIFSDIEEFFNLCKIK